MCVFQNLTDIQNRYDMSAWVELVGRIYKPILNFITSIQVHCSRAYTEYRYTGSQRTCFNRSQAALLLLLTVQCLYYVLLYEYLCENMYVCVHVHVNVSANKRLYMYRLRESAALHVCDIAMHASLLRYVYTDLNVVAFRTHTMEIVCVQAYRKKIEQEIEKVKESEREIGQERKVLRLIQRITSVSFTPTILKLCCCWYCHQCR